MMNTTSPVAVEERARLKRLNFSDTNQREAHVQAFLEWLPLTLHTAPGIDWKRLPSPVMGYFVRTVADSPDAIPLTFAVGCAMYATKQNSLRVSCRYVTNLLRRLRTQYGMSELMQLGTRDIWEQFVSGRSLSPGEAKMLVIYNAFASIHVPAHLEELNVRDRVIWQQYGLPPLPRGFLEKHGVVKNNRAGEIQRRKDQSDVLTPLFPLLVEIAQLRKQAAERLIKEFRRHRDRALVGEIELPYHFQYTAHMFTISQDTPIISSVQLIRQEVTLSLTLWDRMSWAKAHPERYGHRTQQKWRLLVGAYAPERNMYFLQYQGKAKDLLWCGDLIANWRLGKGVALSTNKPENASEKPKRDREFEISRPGLLSPFQSDSFWLRSAMQPGEVLFEPESLYRGALYACALASLALTNGSRVSELLQVSATRFETIVVDELKNQQSTGRKIGVLVQHLLPKGSTQESERQIFLISDMAGRLLMEIGQLLESTNGDSIPIVHPSHSTKKEDLYPEPYLFQWASPEEGRLGLLTPCDVGVLLRFLFHGLTLTTRTGEPIRVAPHLLRHVLATHVRHVQNVPAEAVAYLLHHRVTLPDSTRALSIPEATAYYSRMPVEQLLALLFDAQSRLSSFSKNSYLQVPHLQTLAQMDEALRQVFEQWGLLGPTVLGYCGAGLCVRPDNRALCLGCPFLVPHYSNLRNAVSWRKLFVLQAEMHDAHGHHIDAQQARQMLQHLDNTIAIMRIQIETQQDGGYLPFAETLQSPQDEEGDEI